MLGSETRISQDKRLRVVAAYREISDTFYNNYDPICERDPKEIAVTELGRYRYIGTTDANLTNLRRVAVSTEIVYVYSYESRASIDYYYRVETPRFHVPVEIILFGQILFVGEPRQ